MVFVIVTRTYAHVYVFYVVEIDYTHTRTHNRMCRKKKVSHALHTSALPLHLPTRKVKIQNPRICGFCSIRARSQHDRAKIMTIRLYFQEYAIVVLKVTIGTFVTTHEVHCRNPHIRRQEKKRCPRIRGPISTYMWILSKIGQNPRIRGF